MDYDKMLLKLKTMITNKRYIHSLGVEYTAAALAMVHGADVNKARLAGLLHDCAKGLSASDKLEKAKKHKLPISEYEEKNPDMLHAKLGAYYAAKRFDVSDKEVISAITWHTTGRPDMTLLDKIIFVADYIEPNRKMIKDMEIIRKEAFSDIDLAVIHILKNTIDYLETDGKEMDFATIETYNHYLGCGGTGQA